MINNGPLYVIGAFKRASELLKNHPPGTITATTLSGILNRIADELREGVLAHRRGETETLTWAKIEAGIFKGELKKNPEERKQPSWLWENRYAIVAGVCAFIMLSSVIYNH